MTTKRSPSRPIRSRSSGSNTWYGRWTTAVGSISTSGPRSSATSSSSAVETTERGAEPGADSGRDDGAERCTRPVRWSAWIELEHVDLRARHRRPEATGVDGDRQPARSRRGRASRARRSGPAESASIGVARPPGSRGSAPPSGARARAGRTLLEARAAEMEDEDVVGGDVDEAAKHAALREVDLLAVAGREREIEVADEVERRPADVDAVSDRGRDPSVAAAATSWRTAVGDVVDRSPLGQRRDRLRARSGPTRSCRGSSGRSRSRRASRSRPRRAARSSQSGADLAVAVEDDDVARRRDREGDVDVADEAEVLAPAGGSRPRAATASSAAARSRYRSVSRSGLASSATRIVTSGAVCARTLSRQRTNSSFWP